MESKLSLWKLGRNRYYFFGPIIKALKNIPQENIPSIFRGTNLKSDMFAVDLFLAANYINW